MADEQPKGGFFAKLAAEVFEDTDAPKAPKPPKKKAVAAPIPAVAAPIPAAAAPAPAYVPPVYAPPAPGAPPSSPFTNAFAAAAAEPVDEETLKMISEQVFVDLDGRKSLYIQYENMWQALGRPADPGFVINALNAAGVQIDAGSIATDVGKHIALLDAVSASAKAEFDAASASMLGGADQSVADLQAANTAAQAEIERHQRESAERNLKMQEIQLQRATDDAKIARAMSRTRAAEEHVRARLAVVQGVFTKAL